MVQRRDLNAPPGRRLADAIRAAREAALSSKTGAVGVTDLGEHGDTMWRNPVTGEPSSVRDLPPRIDATQEAIDEAKVELETAQEAIDGAKRDIVDERVAREAALEEANGLLADLDARLSAVPSDSDLQAVRDDLAAARGEVEAAQAAADDAATAAATANANALAAAGIAADKGRIIYAPEPPTDPDDQSTSNLWIDSDDGRVYVWDDSAGEWIESENESLRDAAQAAAAALAAAEAADAKASDAAGAAAAAQDAAEAAQRTANQATTDARAAHNAAVAAQAEADRILAAAGNLVTHGGFETGELRDIFSAMSSIEESYLSLRTSGLPYEGSRFLRFTGGGTYVEVNMADVPVVPGRTYRVSVAARLAPGQGSAALTGSFGWLMYWRDRDGSAWNENRPRLYDYEDMAAHLTDQWQVFTSDVTATDNVTHLVPRFIASAANVPVGLMVDQDALRVIDATDAIAAEQAAADAQARADEAYAEAASKATPAEVEAAADAAEEAAKQAASLDATAKAAQAKADALSEAAVTAQEKADAAKAQAVADAARDAAAKADKALQDALDALAAARGEITAEITASANGKNSITRSTSPASGSGVVEGDAWYQLDANGDAFGMWIWDGASWVPSKVRNEMIDTLDVNKVVGGEGDFETFFAQNLTANDAVVEKLWTDQLVGKTAVLNSITAASGNLIPDLATAIESGVADALGHWRNFEIQGSEEFWVDGADSTARYIEHEFRVKAGVRYRFAVDARASTPGTMFSIRTMDSSGTTVGFGGWTGHGSGSYPFSSVLVPGSEFTTFESTGIAATDRTIKLLIYPNQAGGADNTGGRLLFRNLSVQAMTGAVLIEDGAVGADKIIADEVAAEVSHLVKARVENLTVTDGATIDDAVILKLASEMITAGVLRTAETGQRVVIDETGIVMYGLDPDGVEFELVRIGPDGENLITAGDTTISPAGVQAPSGDFDGLTVGGATLDDWLDPYPKGVVAFAHTTSNSAWHGDGSEIRRLEVSATLLPSRRYRVTLDQHFVQLRTTASTSTWIERLKYNVPGGHNTFAWTRSVLAATGLAQSVPPLLGYIETSSLETEEQWTIGYTTQGPSGRDIRLVNDGDGRLRLTVEDIGPVLVSTGEVLMSGGTAVEGSTGTRPVDPPKVSRYTHTWNAGGYGGDTSAGDVVQGYYSGVGMRSGGWVFPSAMRTALAGAEIEKFEVYLYASHWYWGSGGTASIRPNNGTYTGWAGSAFTSANWPRNAGRWVTVPSSWHSAIAAGTYRGVGVHTTSTNSLYYGRFRGTSTKFRATYRK